MSRPYLFALSCVLLTFVTGCAGYRLGDVKPSAYQGIDNLHVPIFRNDTLEPRLSSLVTNAVLKELHVDGTYKVTSRSNADAILVGRITEIRKNQLRSQRFDTLRSQELQVTLFVEFHLEDPGTGKKIYDTSIRRAVPIGKEKTVSAEDKAILARQGRVSGQTIQIVDNSFQIAEREAFSVAAQDLAAKLVSYIANGF
ncbi:MAG: LptE family protein [Verrucomicrobiota bacterium]